LPRFGGAFHLFRSEPQLWFNEATTEAGCEALGFYHERKDDARNIGPEHDWSSHAADALGLMAICWERPGRAGQGRAFNPADQVCGLTLTFLCS
jgi:hypothetical protein